MISERNENLNDLLNIIEHMSAEMRLSKHASKVLDDICKQVSDPTAPPTNKTVLRLIEEVIDLR